MHLTAHNDIQRVELDWMSDWPESDNTQHSQETDTHAPGDMHYYKPTTYTGLFISPSGISELDCPTTKTDMAERSISIGRESLQVFFCTRGLGVLPGSTARG